MTPRLSTLRQSSSPSCGPARPSRLASSAAAPTLSTVPATLNSKRCNGSDRVPRHQPMAKPASAAARARRQQQRASQHEGWWRPTRHSRPPSSSPSAAWESSMPPASAKQDGWAKSARAPHQVHCNGSSGRPRHSATTQQAVATTIREARTRHCANSGPTYNHRSEQAGLSAIGPSANAPPTRVRGTR